MTYNEFSFRLILHDQPKQRTKVAKNLLVCATVIISYFRKISFISTYKQGYNETGNEYNSRFKTQNLLNSDASIWVTSIHIVIMGLTTN